MACISELILIMRATNPIQLLRGLQTHSVCVAPSKSGRGWAGGRAGVCTALRQQQQQQQQLYVMYVP